MWSSALSLSEVRNPQLNWLSSIVLLGWVLGHSVNCLFGFLQLRLQCLWLNSASGYLLLLFACSRFNFCLKGGDTERKERLILPSGSLPKWLQMPELNWSKAGSQYLFPGLPHAWVQWPKGLEQLLLLFQAHFLDQKWSQTSSYGCLCHRQKLSMLRCAADPASAHVHGRHKVMTQVMSPCHSCGKPVWGPWLPASFGSAPDVASSWVNQQVDIFLFVSLCLH